MGVTFGNPIEITSGTNNTLIFDGALKVSKVYWHQPALGSTSSLVITKQNASTQPYLMLNVEVSGASQNLDFDDGTWWREPYLRMVPTGTLYIYTK